MLKHALAGVLILVPAVLAGQGAGPDWPQFRGPNRDGAVAAFVEPKVWPDRLTERWKVEVGEGHATPVLVSGRVYTFTRQGANEVMQALDAASGKTIWQTRYAAPVIPLYGASTSPLVDRGLVIVHVGGNNQGALTAFDAGTGAVKWAWNGDGPSSASPLAADVDGIRQIITLTQDNVVGVSAADGRLLWRRPFKTEYTQSIIVSSRRRRFVWSEKAIRGRPRVRELKRYTVATSATWSQPVVSGNRIFVKGVASLTMWTMN